MRSTNKIKLQLMAVQGITNIQSGWTIFYIESSQSDSHIMAS